MRPILILGFGLLLLTGCSPLSKKKLNRTFVETEKRFQNHTGFVIYDPQAKEVVFEYQGDRYFTPASNTKILTFFTALTLLQDSLPGIEYIERPDSLIFWGTGDPSLLNKLTFSNSRVLDFLARAKAPIYFSVDNFHTQSLGPGWAWDDYNDNYSQERSPLPIYGNSFSAYPLPDRFLVVPSFFNRFYSEGPPRERVQIIREVSSNNFRYFPGTRTSFREFLIPFRTEPELVANLLADTLHREVTLISRKPDPFARTLFSIPADSVYKVMMQESDNHIAEQLLLMCAGVLSDSLKPEIAIRYMKENHFNTFTSTPSWRDGSGLSRYNLFTPRFIVQVWEKIYERVPRERLFSLLAIGGKAGTIKNWYKAEKPFIYGKTGTLSNNHSLSGYLITQSGKTLIFSFMSGNYTVPTNDIRNNMHRVLFNFYENY
jgi:D-alanyl-D-alanine carboxypeptidase/D-alanyl-D-alanine-endopeptidase (penicillin-binding protein 4)